MLSCKRRLINRNVMNRIEGIFVGDVAIGALAMRSLQSNARSLKDGAA